MSCGHNPLPEYAKSSPSKEGKLDNTDEHVNKKRRIEVAEVGIEGSRGFSESSEKNMKE